jgi:hypothetical protein
MKQKSEFEVSGIAALLLVEELNIMRAEHNKRRKPGGALFGKRFPTSEATILRAPARKETAQTEKKKGAP